MKKLKVNNVGIPIAATPLIGNGQTLRIPMKADTCSNPCRTPFRSCRTVVGAKRLSVSFIKRCPTGVKISPSVLHSFGAPSRGDALTIHPKTSSRRLFGRAVSGGNELANARDSSVLPVLFSRNCQSAATDPNLGGREKTSFAIPTLLNSRESSSTQDQHRALPFGQISPLAEPFRTQPVDNKEPQTRHSANCPFPSGLNLFQEMFITAF
jgi:hypothetical protein